MADSLSNLYQIKELQIGKTQAINELLDAASPATYFGRNAVDSGLLDFAVYGAKVVFNGTLITIPNTKLLLMMNATNYVQLDPVSNTISSNTTRFTPGRIPLYTVSTGPSSVTTFIDNRSINFSRIVTLGTLTSPTIELNAFQVMADTYIVPTQSGPRQLNFPTQNKIVEIFNRSGHIVTVSNGTQSATVATGLNRRFLIEPAAVTGL